jgi:hypothetical protein
MPGAAGLASLQMLGPARLEAAHALARNMTLVTVTEELRASGVRSLVIKGPAVAAWLYEDPGERPYGDVDLLVEPRSFSRAEAVLERMGFRGQHVGLANAEQPENAEHAHTWIRDADDFVDLHRKPMLVPVSPERAWFVLSRGSGTLRIAGTQLETPSPAAHLMIVALHAAQHGGRQPRPLDDLRRAMRQIDYATWKTAAELAAELDAGAAMRAGLSLVEGGPELADRLGLADDAGTVVRLLAARAPATALGIHRLLTARGIRARLRFVARKLVPTAAFLRLWQPVASRGRLGLMLAYLWRPFWLIAKLPPGVAAWAAVTLPSGRVRGTLGGSLWALRAWWRCRAQLRRGGLSAVQLPVPPPARPGGLGGVERSLRFVRATCLERSLVRQRWDAALGLRRDVVIGVRGPAASFGAHAWLEGERGDAAAFEELSRWPAPHAA